MHHALLGSAEGTTMSETELQGARRRNPRLALTQAEDAAVARLLQETKDRALRRENALRDPRRLDVKRALNVATRELFAKASPDFRALADKLADQLKPGLAALKGAGEGFDRIDEAVKLLHRADLTDRITQQETFLELRDWQRMLEKIGGFPFVVEPPFARELWWGETHSFWTGSGLSVDIENDPCRIWGHIAYDGDPLRSGNIGVSKFFFLTPDRFPVRAGGAFEIRPRLRVGGWASGWTGLYHPVWHADDKWSKCWQNLRVTASLSTGEVLDSSTLNYNLFFLEDEFGVGQDNADLFMGWEPILRFGADLADLRARGVSIILEAELRFDYQLEGESDLWLRFRRGSDAESVASFDNAVIFRASPGSVLSV
ncbi:hypothetical protein LJR225_005325 [Phenylobacterium sp. LjRoot225]|uniref:hypothetical protein n=1 Tax=Phenylobacterium sp. LjRoot225 TaxID=3342285 RepID=UPI003ECC8984